MKTIDRYPIRARAEQAAPSQNPWRLATFLAIAALIAGNQTVHAQINNAGFAIVRFLDSGGSSLVNAGDAANSALRVNIVAGSSAGTTYTEDVASAGAEVMTMAGAIRDDATSVTTTTDGDFSTLKTDANGRLWTNGSEVTQPVSGSVSVSGTVTSTVTPSLTASANNDGGCVSMTTTSATVLASFATRRFGSICAAPTNSDTVFIKLGTTATTADYPIYAGQCWNTPGATAYTGVIDGRSNTGTQSVCVLEW